MSDWTPDDATVEKAARAAKPNAWKEDGHFNAQERKWRREAALADARATLGAVVPGLVAEAVKAEREKVAQWMIAHSFATGHGDTIDDLLIELELSLRELRVGHP